MGMARCLECERYGDSKDAEGIWNSDGWICDHCCEEKTEEELEKLQNKDEKCQN